MPKCISESSIVEFKQTLDFNSTKDCCELVRSMVAMANSGGGIVILGIKKDGTVSELCPEMDFCPDPAIVTDKISSYTGEQFSNFEIVEINREGCKLPAFLVYSTAFPMVMIKPGTYFSAAHNRQESAFARGSVYFRHGAKSEPCNSDDLHDAFDRRLEVIKQSWIADIKKVVEAPPGSVVKVYSPEVRESPSPSALPIRIVNDPDAPAYYKIDPDQTHPFRTKDVVEKINECLAGKTNINHYDILCIRKAYSLDDRPAFYYHPKFSSAQFNQEFIDWVVNQYSVDARFFYKAREKRKQIDFSSHVKQA